MKRLLPIFCSLFSLACFGLGATHLRLHHLAFGLTCMAGFFVFLLLAVILYIEA